MIECRTDSLAQLDTRQALIRAGIEMLSERGFVATGIERILKACEVPKGSFYHYFASKNAFGLEVLVDRHLKDFTVNVTLGPLAQSRLHGIQKPLRPADVGVRILFVRADRCRIKARAASREPTLQARSANISEFGEQRRLERRPRAIVQGKFPTSALQGSGHRQQRRDTDAAGDQSIALAPVAERKIVPRCGDMHLAAFT